MSPFSAVERHLEAHSVVCVPSLLCKTFSAPLMRQLNGFVWNGFLTIRY